MQITSSAIKLKDSDRMCQSQGNMNGDIVDATADGLDADAVQVRGQLGGLRLGLGGAQQGCCQLLHNRTG